MRFLYRNWFVHNTLAHPLHELVYLTMRLLMFGKSRSRTVSDWIHDVTIPVEGPSTKPSALSMLLHDKEATTEKIREKLKAEKIEELKEQKERYATQMAAQDWYA